MTGSDDCPGHADHAGLAGELRALALLALDRLEPALERVRAEGGVGAEGGAEGGTCSVCPVCAVIAALRGERPELAGRLAEHAVGLLAVLRSALEEGAGGRATEPAGAAVPDPAPRVQHIPVTRP